MQRRASSFNGFTIEATDGCVGSISDMLFTDNDWTMRWFVVNTGSWLLGRKLLIHPTALAQPDIRQRAFSVTLTKADVESSPELSSDPPVSQQIDTNQYDYALDSSWGGGIYTGDMWQNYPTTPSVQSGDPHLRSLAEVTGYHIHALDGDIGHLEDVLIDDETWHIEFAVVDTKNWGFGSHVLVSSTEMKEVSWPERYIRIDLTRYKIKCNPPWQEPDLNATPTS